jgi:hypothetical protein
MTDDLHHRDELASAHLDGETSPAEDEQVAADDALRERVDVLGEVRRRVGAPPPAPPPERRDAAVAAALAAFDAEAGAGPEAPVRTLPRRREGLGLRVLAAAAVVLVALALIPALASLGDGGGDDTMASGSPEEQADDADEAATMESADAESPTANALAEEEPPVLEGDAGDDSSAAAALAPDLIVLGAFDDVEALRAEVERRLLDDAVAAETGPDEAVVDDGPGSGEATEHDPELVECYDTLTGDESGEVRLRARAVLADEEVLVIVVDERLVVASLVPEPAGPACRVVTELTLGP